MELVDKMLAGEQQALARLITLVEWDAPDVPQIMRAIYPHTGNAYCIGITGPPGGGKSTLADRLTALMRKQDLSVGIVAVDPTSPFSGGAVLGDRIRMQQHYLDSGVFIRSMATRGSQGGLPLTTQGVIKLFDAYGMDIILVETVGVGQTELEIMEMADTTVVVLVPEAGDAIQALKAGLMEIADVFVVNKADREGAELLAGELGAMLMMNPKQSWWPIPVLLTQATNNIGIEELYLEIQRHREAQEQTERLAERRQERRKTEFLQTIEQRVRARLLKLMEGDKQLMTSLEKVAKRELDPYSAATQVLQNESLIKGWLAEIAKET